MTTDREFLEQADDPAMRSWLNYRDGTGPIHKNNALSLTINYQYVREHLPEKAREHFEELLRSAHRAGFERAKRAYSEPEQIKYRSPEWYEMRNRLVASLHDVRIPTGSVEEGERLSRFPDLLDIARGKAPYNHPGLPFANVSGSPCPGCNWDDRGFVVVQGCPVHDPKAGGTTPATRPSHSTGDGVAGD